MLKTNVSISLRGRNSSLFGSKGDDAQLVVFEWVHGGVSNFGRKHLYYGLVVGENNGRVDIVKPSQKWVNRFGSTLLYGWVRCEAECTVSSHDIIKNFPFYMDYKQLNELMTYVDLEELVNTGTNVLSCHSSPEWLTDDFNINNISSNVKSTNRYPHFVYLVVSVFAVYYVPPLFFFVYLYLIKRCRHVYIRKDGQFVPWFVIKRSRIAGHGLFADTHFSPDQMVSKYLGEITDDCDIYTEWLEDKYRRQYICQIGQTWIAPKIVQSRSPILEDLLFAHYMNHSNNPNCHIDQKSGAVYTNYAIKKGDELTIDYNNKDSIYYK
jgi:hypothetical protein